MVYVLFVCVFVTISLLSYVVFNKYTKDEELSNTEVLRNWAKILSVLGPLTIFLNKLNKQIFARGSLAKYKEAVSDRLKYVDSNSSTDADSFIVLQELSGVATVACGLLLLPLLKNQQSISIFAVLAFAILMFSVGPMLVYLTLINQIKNKKRTILKSWPFALDLIAISVQAGMDIVRAVELFVENRSKKDPLTMELKCFLNELNLGKRRSDALLDLGQRLDSPNINSVVVDIVQAEQMGTPLAAVLKMESKEYRSRRAQIAEKKALEAPVKMLFPLLFCIFPSVFVVLLGPLLIQFMSGAK